MLAALWMPSSDELPRWVPPDGADGAAGPAGAGSDGALGPAGAEGSLAAGVLEPLVAVAADVFWVELDAVPRTVEVVELEGVRVAVARAVDGVTEAADAGPDALAEEPVMEAITSVDGELGAVNTGAVGGLGGVGRMTRGGVGGMTIGGVGATTAGSDGGVAVAGAATCRKLLESADGEVFPATT